MGLSCYVKMIYRWSSEFNACDDGSKVSDGTATKVLMHVSAALGSKYAGSCISNDFSANRDGTRQRACATGPTSDAGEFLCCRAESETDEFIGSARHFEQTKVAVRRRGRRSGRQDRNQGGGTRKGSKGVVAPTRQAGSKGFVTARLDATTFWEPSLLRGRFSEVGDASVVTESRWRLRQAVLGTLRSHTIRHQDRRRTGGREEREVLEGAQTWGWSMLGTRVQAKRATNIATCGQGTEGLWRRCPSQSRLPLILCGVKCCGHQALSAWRGAASYSVESSLRLVIATKSLLAPTRRCVMHWSNQNDRKLESPTTQSPWTVGRMPLLRRVCVISTNKT